MKNRGGDSEERVLTVTTAFGVLKIFCTEKGVRRLEFPERSFASNKETTEKSAKTPAGTIEKSLTKQLSDYFSGKKVNFTAPVDLDGMAPFDKKVLKELSKIPYGNVLTYKQLARKIGGGKYARAVGNALGRNPVPVILPCHRVIKSDGSLGGFSGGILWKRILLALENRKDLV